MTARTFRAPLFGDSSLIVFRLFAAELLDEHELTLWASDGIPSIDETVTVTVRTRNRAGGDLTVEAGHVPMVNTGLGTEGGRLPLEGASAEWRGRNLRSNVSLGQARYPLQISDGEAVTPMLFAAAIERGTENAYGTIGLFASDAALGEDREANGELIITPGFARRLNLSTEIFAEAPVRLRGGFGYRAGARWNLLAYGLEASFFDHGREMPQLPPLFRPGESGLDLAARIAPAEGTMIRGTATLLRRELRESSDDFRGRLMLTHALPAYAARILVLYDHNQYQYRGLDDDDRGGVRNRLVIAIDSRRLGERSELRLHHDFESDAAPDRTQATLQWTRLAPFGRWGGDVLVQRESSDAWGATVDMAAYVPWRGRYQWIGGGAATWSSRDAASTGEGAIRLGVLRENTFADGWHGALEVRIPVSIGLSPVDSSDVQLAGSLGNRFRWDSFRDLLPAFGVLERLEGRGTIEGTVRAEGPIPGLPILLDGELATVTDDDGRFRLVRVKEGIVTVTVDLSRADPSLSGETSRAVDVVAGATATVDFRLARGYFVQGVLLCAGREPPVPIAGAAVALVGEAIAYQGRTSAVGGYQFSSVTPGRYQLLVDAATGSPRLDAAAAEPVEIQVDSDVSGQVTRVPCLPD